MVKKLKEQASNKSTQATVLGIATSLFMSICFIDYSSFDFDKKSDLIKLILILVPAIGGALSTINTRETRGKKNSLAASFLGFITSLCTAHQVIDYETFDLTKKSNIVKLFAVSLPAIGGLLSSIKEVPEK